MSSQSNTRSKLVVQIIDNGIPTGSPITVVGRDAWCLQRLISAGKRGFSSIEQPAPRTSHYIYKLRRFGFAIETKHEAHGGEYPGTHARWSLHSEVRILEGKTA